MAVKIAANPPELRIPVKATERRIPIKFTALQTVTAAPDAEVYTGDYEVTPKVEAQTFPTAQKFLTNDMTVKSIPRYDVSNTAGGTTVYIGKELE